MGNHSPIFFSQNQKGEKEIMSKIIYLLKRSIDYAISLGQNPNAQKYRWERYGIIETAFYLDLIDKKMYEKLCKEYFY